MARAACILDALPVDALIVPVGVCGRFVDSVKLIIVTDYVPVLRGRLPIARHVILDAS